MVPRTRLAISRSTRFRLKKPSPVLQAAISISQYLGIDVGFESLRYYTHTHTHIFFEYHGIHFFFLSEGRIAVDHGFVMWKSKHLYSCTYSNKVTYFLKKQKRGRKNFSLRAAIVCRQDERQLDLHRIT